MAKRKKPKAKKKSSTITSRAEKNRRKVGKKKIIRGRKRQPLLGKRYSSERIVELVQMRKVPQMIKHCVLKVQAKLKGQKPKDGRVTRVTSVNEYNFNGAFNICMNTFQTYGYMYQANWSKMTFKGIKRNRKHLREASMNRMKNAQFKKLYNDSMKKKIEIYLEEQELKKQG